MTTPTPPVQDGELPDLRCDETKFWHAQIDKREETIDTQSAELAALREQVEGLEKDKERLDLLDWKYRFRMWNQEYGTTENVKGHVAWMIFSTDKLDIRDAIDALAPPQPVAKETKP